MSASPHSSDSPVAVKTGRRSRRQVVVLQQRALEQLAGGLSIHQTASAVGVDRRTVHRWLQRDARFRAAYNAWQQEMIDSSRAQLLTLLGDAVTAVSQSVKKGDARIGTALLRHLSVVAPPSPANCDPQLVRHALALEEEEQKKELDRRARAVGRQDLSPVLEREDLMGNLNREYVGQLRNLADEVEDELDRREGKPPRPRLSSYERSRADFDEHPSDRPPPAPPPASSAQAPMDEPQPVLPHVDAEPLPVEDA